MTSNKPYFIRALYEWILDNNFTPHLLVEATLPYVEVPEEFVIDGKIILNILPSAIQSLILSNEWVSFSARFSGVSRNIELPMGSIIAIYAQENGQGMGFEVEALPIENIIDPPPKSKNQQPALAVISTDEPDNDLKADKTKKTTKKSAKKTTKKTTLKIIK